jgi:UDP-N-acetyl-D-glucosamine/UDP-N-acetyl-D-galactosamine dehydrogenase
MHTLSSIKIVIIGLGYVGLPLALEFSYKRKERVVGYDISLERVQQLQQGIDITREVDLARLKEASNFFVSCEKKDIEDCNFYIITVPTPIDAANKPDLTPLIQASELVGSCLKEGDIVVYESTVYPGATEEVCVPILEKFSNLRYNSDFYCGYSPERINPGDKEHNVTNIKKITSGSDEASAELIDQLYQQIVVVGTYKAASIKIAEAAKVIENTQRDLNIALINELSIIFNKLDIDTYSVLEAAGTKWNFLPFTPGLVGGHCIGVDPYYLTFKSMEIGYKPQVILSGRELNDGMAKYTAERMLDSMRENSISIINSKVLIMGITFKENCPDIRNTKTFDLIDVLLNAGCDISIYDPVADLSKLQTSKYHEFIVQNLQDNTYDGIAITVAHEEFCSLSPSIIQGYCKEQHVIYDLKSILPNDIAAMRM